MKLSGILKSFEKTKNKLEVFLDKNGAEIANTTDRLSELKADQNKAKAVHNNIKALLDE